MELLLPDSDLQKMAPRAATSLATPTRERDMTITNFHRSRRTLMLIYTLTGAQRVAGGWACFKRSMLKHSGRTSERNDLVFFAAR